MMVACEPNHVDVKDKSKGFAQGDYVLKSHLSHKPLQVRDGDAFEILELEDIKAKVRFTSGEARGKSFVLDRMLLRI